ncbi:MAG TPA: hypothetical protein VIE36_09715 [Methylomirabilota bacterium]
MAELIHEFTTRVKDRGAVSYVAQAWGRRMEDGRWEGWLVFLPVTRGFARRTGRETTQANIEALAYWVTGVEPVYLEGALERSYPLRLDAVA